MLNPFLTLFTNKIDSGRIAIPLNECEVIQERIIEEIAVTKSIKATGDLVEEHTKRREPIELTYKEDGTYIKVWVQPHINKKSNTADLYLELLINSKWLKPLNEGEQHQYFAGITKDNFYLLYQNIMALNIFRCSYDSFKKARYNDIDICFDFTTTKEGFIGLRKSIKEMLHNRDKMKEYKNNNFEFPNVTKKPREQATPTNPYVKFYDKYLNFTEGKEEHQAFAKTYFKPSEYEGVYRCEATLSNGKHKKRLGVDKACRTIWELLSTDLKTLQGNIFKEYFPKERAQRIQQEKKQTPTYRKDLALVRAMIDLGATTSQIEECFTLDYEGKQLYRQRNYFYKLMQEEEIDKKQLDKNNQDVSNVLSHLGFKMKTKNEAKKSSSADGKTTPKKE